MSYCGIHFSPKHRAGSNVCCVTKYMACIMELEVETSQARTIDYDRKL